MSLEQLSISATFFGAIVALIIFRQWKSQKGSEVIANEAKTIVYKIKKLSRYYINNNYKIDRNTIKNVAEDGIVLIEDLIEILDFTYRSISNKNDKLIIISFSNTLNSNFYSYKTILNITKTDDEIKEILRAINSKYYDNNKEILKLMVAYALYKKTI
jgi:hypothetical protein